jgi:hypothetical protein
VIVHAAGIEDAVHVPPQRLDAQQNEASVRPRS